MQRSTPGAAFGRAPPQTAAAASCHPLTGSVDGRWGRGLPGRPPCDRSHNLWDGWVTWTAANLPKTAVHGGGGGEAQPPFTPSRANKAVSPTNDPCRRETPTAAQSSRPPRGWVWGGAPAAASPTRPLRQRGERPSALGTRGRLLGRRINRPPAPAPSADRRRRRRAAPRAGPRRVWWGSRQCGCRSAPAAACCLRAAGLGGGGGKAGGRSTAAAAARSSAT